MTMTTLFSLIAASVLTLTSLSEASEAPSLRFVDRISMALILTQDPASSQVFARIELDDPRHLSPQELPVVVLPAGMAFTHDSALYRTAARLTLTPGAPAVLVPVRPPLSSLSE